MNRISVKAIIEHEGKFLFARQHFNTTFWCCLGGGLEPGEDLFSALKRKLVEEANIEPVIGNLLFIQQIKTEQGYNLPEFFFHVTNSDAYLNHDKAGSTHGEKELADIDWVDPSQVTIKPEFLTERLPVVAVQNFEINTEIHLTEVV